MVVIIKKEKGKIIYNNIDCSEQDKARAHCLDEALARISPKIKDKWTNRIMQGGRVNVEVVHEIGCILASVVDDDNLVSSSERKWVWKALREIYLKDLEIVKRGETRDDLEYFYQLSRYPLKIIKNISLDGWRKIFESMIVRQDLKRFDDWFKQRTKRWDAQVPRGMIRQFFKILFSLIKNKDTTVLSDEEICVIYEKAWEGARMKYFVDGEE